MKKWRGIAILLLAFFVLGLTAGVANADGPRRLGPWQELETYVSVNSYSAATGNPSLTVLSATTDLTIAKHRIMGFVVMPHDVGANAELTLGLYDATTAATLTEANCFDEAEWDDDGNNQPRWYPYPKRLTNGLAFIQGGNTVAIIYYEDMTK